MSLPASRRVMLARPSRGKLWDQPMPRIAAKRAAMAGICREKSIAAQAAPVTTVQTH